MNILKLRKRFLALSGIGMQQAAFGTALDADDIDTRDNVTIEITDDRTRETVYDCGGQDIHEESIQTQLKRVTITYNSVTAQIIARWLAYFLGAAAAPTGTGPYVHALTRSSSDDLPKISFISGFEDDANDPRLYKDFVVDSITLNLNRRRNVTMTVVLVGNFTTAAAASFAVPDCENLPALKSKDCKISIDGTDYSSDLWQCGIQLNNNVPTGDDAFPFDGADVETLERGEKPTYSLTPQILGYRGDTLFADAETEEVQPVVVQFGPDAGDRVVLSFPSTKLKFASPPTVFVGELNRTAINIEATPHKDATLLAPLKADCTLAQATAFLTQPS
jgi:hypothetical protein